MGEELWSLEDEDPTDGDRVPPQQQLDDPSVFLECRGGVPLTEPVRPGGHRSPRRAGQDRRPVEERPLTLLGVLGLDPVHPLQQGAPQRLDRRLGNSDARIGVVGGGLGRWQRVHQLPAAQRSVAVGQSQQVVQQRRPRPLQPRDMGDRRQLDLLDLGMAAELVEYPQPTFEIENHLAGEERTSPLAQPGRERSATHASRAAS